MNKTKYMQVTASNPFNSQSKMLHHIDKLHEYMQTKDTTPILMEINLTNNCPLNCVWCISDYSHTDESIDTKTLLQFLKEYKDSNGLAVTWSGGGEPTAHKDIQTIMEKTSQLNLDQGLMTCGIYKPSLNNTIEDTCSWVRYSLDTINAQRYQQLKGRDGLDHVLSNIKNINKDKVKVGVNMNLPYDDTTYDYQKDITNIINMCNENNVKYFQIRPVLPRFYKKEQISDDQLHMIQEQIQYLKNVDKLSLVAISWDKYYDLLQQKNTREYTKCEGHIFEPVLDANGDIDVCMYHLKNKDFVMGNIYDNTFDEIWNSNQRKKVKKHCNNLDFNNCQVCCKPHEINKFLNYVNIDIEDKNFI